MSVIAQMIGASMVRWQYAQFEWSGGVRECCGHVYRHFGWFIRHKEARH